MIVPEVSALAEESLAELRAACDVAVAQMLAADPDVVLVLGAGMHAEAYRSGDWGSLQRYGVPVSAVLGAGACAGRGRLPLSLTVGAWLMQRTAFDGDLQGFSVPDDAEESSLAQWSREIAQLGAAGGRAGSAEKVGLLVMGDGSARRDTTAPGYVDERAPAFDDAVAAALGTGDADTLAQLDAAEGRRLMVAGAQVWRLVGRAAALSRDEGTWRAHLLSAQAPYGVGYFVAAWTHDRTGLRPEVGGGP